MRPAKIQSLSWVPVKHGPPIAAVSIATLCHVPHSGLLTLPGVFEFFDIGCWQITASPLLLPGP
ncbi:unnamed protein product [Staurois parvus]|uniref:Uncharacterized protein n=1 Tax=Staurois parvus TaxID=386267 RepID=A0ABN9EYT4_9NEOB|nr:unnamed protein product [Staurois parvus]